MRIVNREPTEDREPRTESRGTPKSLPVEWYRMTHKDGGWRPDVGMESFGGLELWDHGIGPHEINAAEVDGKIEFPEELKEGLGQLDKE